MALLPATPTVHAAPSRHQAAHTSRTTDRAVATERAALIARGAGSITSPGGPHSLEGPNGVAGDQGLVQVADLNGDGLRDVIDVRYIVADNGRDVTTLTARVGDTGRALWHRDLATSRCSADDSLVAPMRVGPKGKSGVLVLRADCGDPQTQQSGGVVTALSGKTGRPAWNAFVPGAFPSFLALGNALPGPASDVIAAVQLDRPKHTIVHPIVIDGTNGEVRRLPRIRTALPKGAIENPARVFAVPDLNGDGLDDVLIDSPTGAMRGLTAETATGTTIWHKLARRLGTVVAVRPVGRLGIGTVSNLAISAYGVSRPLLLQQTLVKGSTGRTIWRRPGAVAIRIDRAGSHLVAAVAVIKEFPPLKEYSGGHRVGIIAQAVGVHDHVIWTRKLLRRSSEPVDPGDAAQGFEITEGGDVEPDGAHEIQVSLLGVPGKRGLISGLVDGRTGKLLPNDLGLPADGSFTHAAGTDSIGFGVPPRHEFDEISVEGRDGLSNKLYFSRVFKLPLDALGLPVAARVTPKCSSIALATIATGPQLDAIVSGSGHLLWKLTFAGGQKFGGKLVRGKPSRRYCWR